MEHTEPTEPTEQPKRYGKLHCSDCGKEREPEATQYSYCVDCGRKRQRKRYRDGRTASGALVTPRIDDSREAEDRRTYLMAADDKPGKCESCGQGEPDGLVLEHAGDPVKDPGIYWSQQPLTLLCRECSRLLHVLDPQELRRITLLVQHLAYHKTTRQAIAPLTLAEQAAAQK